MSLACLKVLINPKVRAALEETGLPWEIRPGKKHFQIRLAGRMIGILPLNIRKKGTVPHEVQNVLAQIKRCARGHAQ